MKTNGINEQHENDVESLVAQVEANARAVIESAQTGASPDQLNPSTAATVAVMAHLDDVAERAVLAQCSEIRKLVTEAQELEMVLLTDLARVKAVIALCLNNGDRAATLAASIRGCIDEMASEHVVSLQPT